MLTRKSFEYAIIRVVPRVEREEFINAGVIVFSLECKYLGARLEIEERRLLALWPGADFELIRDHLKAMADVCVGLPTAGPIALLPLRERFHWLVAPRSTMIQVSPVHAGICESTVGLVESLFAKFVAVS